MNQENRTNQKLLEQLINCAGKKNILVNAQKSAYYRHGYRSGGGDALAVVFPTSLVKQWQLLKICVKHRAVIIMQAANTGLTEGSTPSGNDYDRPVVVINVTRLKTIHTLKNATQIISLPGATLFSLEKLLAPFKRTPHSVIGSSCLGASIIGGIANNSGGALVKRGPAYTEYSLFAQVNADGELTLVNHLGIQNLGDTPETILTNLEQGNFNEQDVISDQRIASDQDYTQRIRDINANTPARYNADPRRLYEASGCAGKVAIFAVRLDTYAAPKQEQTFYIGTNNTEVLSKLRQHILSTFTHLPEVGEYMHRDVFNLSESYGKDTFLLIDLLGTDPLPKLFAIKGRIETFLNRFTYLPKFLPDRLLQFISRCWPSVLPKRLLQFRDQYEHHLILKMSDAGIDEAKQFLQTFFKENDGDFFMCTATESKKAFLHRFAAAGAAIRYGLLKNKAVLALDIALPRNAHDWLEQLPDSIDSQLEHKLYYGHFFCHVFHQDYIAKDGADTKLLKEAMLAQLDSVGAKYPAEHNVGHLYEAEKTLQDFYQQLDPTNSFNAGIGKTSKTCC